MRKKRHHFVPRFYLRSFRSSPRRIHIYNINRDRVIIDASLRDQCQRPSFYGTSDEVEDWLSGLESRIAPVIRKICETAQPPAAGTEERALFLGFVSLQLLRTPAARDRIVSSWKAFDQEVFGDGGRGRPEDLGLGPIHEDELLRLQLASLDAQADAIDDLVMMVASCGRRDKLITSDNPVVKYNSYCRGIRFSGVDGALKRGLQIFVPLSPTILVLLFDGWVYDVGVQDGTLGRCLKQREVQSVNALQMVNADLNVYFSDLRMANCVRRQLAGAHAASRGTARARVIEAPEVGNPGSALVHMYREQPHIEFTTPFSRLRMKAKRIPLSGRANLFRVETPRFEGRFTRIFRHPGSS